MHILHLKVTAYSRLYHARANGRRLQYHHCAQAGFQSSVKHTLCTEGSILSVGSEQAAV